MKTFLKWCEEISSTLVTDTPEGEEPTGENTKRTGLTYNYPDAYMRGQYPKEYFPAIKATAILDLQQKPKRVPDTAAK
jgi:hypothetical protein